MGKTPAMTESAMSCLSIPAPVSLPSPRVMFRAFTRRDSAYEGVFYAAVKTTGIFCRPTCRAKKPRAENVEYFASLAEALQNGYRPCRLCRPMDHVPPPPPVVKQLLRAVEASPGARVTDKDLQEMGVDPSTARRGFRSCYGLTFQAFQRARRMGVALQNVRAGKPAIEAQMDGGYESTSGFRGAFRRTFGKPPGDKGTEDCLFARRIGTPLGEMLALADKQGLRLLEFEDQGGLERAVASLARGLACAVVPGTNTALEAAEVQLRRYFAGELFEFDLPLAPVGSTFELAVWAALLRIPAGSTRSYAQVAAEIGRPGAQRAVGRANGSNRIAIVIPCHRVVRSDGALSGYAGGVWRKQRLLDLERGAAGKA
jgi:AraC family transcriptional regulator of adaptative response/methylated-DNA-[protein]-cysteine methyltransferase